MSTRLAAFLWRFRYPLSAFILVGAIAFAPRANITRIDNDITAWFSKSDPVYRDYERFRDEFGGTRTLIVALQADSPDVLFSRPSLEAIRDITGDIERVPTVVRVDSLATATIVEALSGEEEGGLDVRPLLDDLDRRPPASIRRRALGDELIRGDLVSEDATVTAIVVTFDEERIDEVRAGVIDRIHTLVDARLPAGVTAYYNGSIEISETYNRVTLANQFTFTPPILLITLLAVFATFRSWRKTLLTIVAVGVSVLWTLGLYSLMGFTYNVLASMLVPLIVVLAIADDVHIMQHWDEERRRLPAEAAFKSTVAHLAAPLLAASGTTALGMASLATSHVVAVRSFGIGSAVGIMVDCAISLVFVPTLLSLMKPEPRETPHERLLTEPLRRIALLSTRHPKRVLLMAGIVAVAGMAGMLRLRVDTNHINFFSPDHPLGRSARVIDGKLSGIYSFQIMLEGAPESLRAPENLLRMERIEERLREFDNVRKVSSIADYVKRINRELHDGREEENRVPTDPRVVAQELFVFTLGGEGRHELQRIAASDYSRAHISVKLRSMSSDTVLTEVERADALAKQVFADSGITVTTTGSGRLFATLDHYLVTSQLSSFGTAFLTVFAVIFVVFRSIRYGLLTIAPNLLPVLVVLGIMGFLDISMNVATVMVASVALGIVDDDTIHFINRYRRETAAGAGIREAIQIATTREGRASLSTAIINSAAFSVLLLSEYKPTAWFGGLLGLTMALAFLAEVFILPATIVLLPRLFGGRPPGDLTPGDLTPRSQGAQRDLTPRSQAAKADLTPSRQGANRDLTPSRRGANRDLTPRSQAAKADLTPRSQGAQRDLTPRSQAAKMDLTLRHGLSLGALASAFVLLFVPAAVAQERPTGYVSVFADHFPERDATELRARVFAEEKIDRGRIRVVLSGFAEGLAGERNGRITDAVARPWEASVELRTRRADVTFGLTRVVWGRLDELQPTDVVNPLDVSRFFFDGRGEARLPVPLVRARVYAGEAASIEAVVVPVFRRGVFDALDEDSSPFNPVVPGIAVCQAIGVCPPAPVVAREEPATTWRNLQGGARFTATTGRVDWSVAAFRGFEPFGLIASPEGRRLPVRFPRYSMIGADFETVRGPWGVRGEAAFFDRSFQSPTGIGIVDGQSLDAGAGLDRRAGDYRIGASLLVHHERYDVVRPGDAGGRTDVSVIVSADRNFARDRYTARVFGVVDPPEGSAFLRGILTAKVRDDVAVEGSVGWFGGSGRDVVGRFGDSDFGYLRLKYYF